MFRSLRLRMAVDANARLDDAVAWLESHTNLERIPAAAGAFGTASLAARFENFRSVVAALNVTQRVPVVHVAGTKGKGSFCAMLEQVLVAAGYRVGRFSSPHLHSLRERFAIDGVPVSVASFASAIETVAANLEALAVFNLSSLSFFDLTFLVAEELFRQHCVDIAIIEVGMGGRFDSTNVCTPSLSVITSISLDHTQELGSTLSQIAAEKAGIIRGGIPVISGVSEDEPAAVIRTVAASHSASLRELGRDFFATSQKPRTFDYISAITLPRIELGCWGRHQHRNAALAIDAALCLSRLDIGISVSETTIRQGLSRVSLPARIEVVSQRPLIIIDAAHNRASAAALVVALGDMRRAGLFRGAARLVFGTTQGKDIDGMLAELLPFFDDIVLTQYAATGRAVSTSELAKKLYCCRCIDDCHAAFDTVRNTCDADDLICVTGSFYLAAPLREQIAPHLITP